MTWTARGDAQANACPVEISPALAKLVSRPAAGWRSTTVTSWPSACRCPGGGDAGKAGAQDRDAHAGRSVARGGDHDLDGVLRRGELALDAGAAGVLPGATPASHTAFISSKVAMSESQTLALSSLDLSLPAWASRRSMIARMSLVCSVTEPPGALRATWPARYTVLPWTTAWLIREPTSKRLMLMLSPRGMCVGRLKFGRT